MNLYRFLFFAIFIFISKEILVFNEEFLILFAFICFSALWLNYFSSFIYDELNQRKLKLLEEFNVQYNLEKNILLSLIDFNNKKTTILLEVKDISIFVLSEIIKMEFAYFLVLYSKIHSDIDYKLSKLSNMNSKSILYSLLYKKFTLIFNKYFIDNKSSIIEKCLFFRALLSSKSLFLRSKQLNRSKKRS